MGTPGSADASACGTGRRDAGKSSTSSTSSTQPCQDLRHAVLLFDTASVLRN